eukprot:TRINITY_DN1029_c0_g1_i1.p3 TRINITY_DN1029_c0_g1~~TRINITY_DN1029_c0_g1_i1.p3  ORF type:complete len:320 (+),score=51.01 TRINITY_DN1029_c0_g1_i1:5063-6022(+)
MEKKEVPSGCPGGNCDTCPMRAQCMGAAPVISEASQENPITAKILSRMKDVKHKVLILSCKGGVGKSTLTSQLAFALSNFSAKDGTPLNIGVLDIDLCGPCIPQMMGVEDEGVHQSASGWSPVFVGENLCVMSMGFLMENKGDALIWRGPRKNGMIQSFLSEVAWEGLDVLLVDTPPGTSDEKISIIQMLNATCKPDGAVLVTTPQDVALTQIKKEIQFCGKTKTKVLGIVENMSFFCCPHCQKETALFNVGEGAEKVCAENKVSFLGKIPLDPHVVKACEKGEPVGKSIPTDPAAKAIEKVAAALLDAIGVERQVKQL